MDTSERLCIHDKKTTTPHTSHHTPHCTYSVHTTYIPYRLTALYIHTTIYATQHVTQTLHTYIHTTMHTNHTPHHTYTHTIPYIFGVSHTCHIAPYTLQHIHTVQTYHAAHSSHTNTLHTYQPDLTHRTDTHCEHTYVIHTYYLYTIPSPPLPPVELPRSKLQVSLVSWPLLRPKNSSLL